MPNFESYAQSIILNHKKARFYHITAPHLPTIHSHHSPLSAHFYGGNGFTTGVYAPLLLALTDIFDISSLAMQGYWYDKPTARKTTREQDADLLIEFLQKTQDRPVIGIAHSQGATATTIACAKCPELFSELFLLEPVSFTKSQYLLYRNVPRSIKLTREPFKSTLTKPTVWESIDTYYQHLREHRAFKRISDEHLKLYAQNSLQRNSEGKFELIFSPEQELANYFDTPFINDALAKIQKDDKVPYTIIMGKPSMFISEKVRASWRNLVPDTRLIELTEYGHLLPIEAPNLCATLIRGIHAKR